VLPLDESTLEAVRAGMRAAVSSSRGTASRVGLGTYRAAAKTGTAEAGAAGDHAWIVGYAPAEAPEVAFAVVVEHVAAGLHGGDVAGPVAAAMLAAWVERQEGDR
jgi:cell division protein FtsI/penicillin-binding protein 2